MWFTHGQWGKANLDITNHFSVLAEELKKKISDNFQFFQFSGSVAAGSEVNFYFHSGLTNVATSISTSRAITATIMASTTCSVNS